MSKLSNSQQAKHIEIKKKQERTSTGEEHTGKEANEKMNIFHIIIRFNVMNSLIT